MANTSWRSVSLGKNPDPTDEPLSPGRSEAKERADATQALWKTRLGKTRDLVSLKDGADAYSALWGAGRDRVSAFAPARDGADAYSALFGAGRDKASNLPPASEGADAYSALIAKGLTAASDLKPFKEGAEGYSALAEGVREKVSAIPFAREGTDAYSALVEKGREKVSDLTPFKEGADAYSALFEKSLGKDAPERDRMEGVPTVRYQVVPLSEEEWSKLSDISQKAVVANQLLMEAAGDGSLATEVYDYLGSTGASAEGSSYTPAPLEDLITIGDSLITRLKSEKYSSEGAFFDKGTTLGGAAKEERQLSRLRQIAGGIDPLAELPNDIAKILGRGVSDTVAVALDGLNTTDPALRGVFPDMIAGYQSGYINEPGVIDLFNKDFTAAIEGLPLREVSNRFRAAATAAKEEDPSIDIEAMMKFYGLNGE